MLIIGIFLLLLLALAYGAWHPRATLSGPIMSRGEPGSVYLTFDDGPGPDTESVVSVLREEGVKATFFLVGTQAAKHPEIVELLVKEGHAIGTHSWSHWLLLTRNEEEIVRGKEAVEIITGQEVTLFRPPYGFRTWKTHRVAAREGLVVVTWSVFPRDYRRSSEDIISHVCARLHDGAIIDLHDGPYERGATIASLPAIISCAREQGYAFGVLGAPVASRCVEMDQQCCLEGTCEFKRTVCACGEQAVFRGCDEGCRPIVVCEPLDESRSCS